MRVIGIGYNRGPDDACPASIRVRYEADGHESSWLPYPTRLKGVAVPDKCLAYGGYREASRILLEVTAVRVERVQEISEDGAVAEGIRRDTIAATGDHPELECWVTIPDDNHAYVTPIDAFEKLWDSLNAKRGFPWSANPWVWVIEFKVLTTEAKR